MPDTGLLLPGNANQGAGWLNPTNLLSDDGAVASSNGSQTSSGNLRAFQFTLAIPAGAATYDGFEAEFEVTAVTGTGTLNVGPMTNGSTARGTTAIAAAVGTHTIGGEGTRFGIAAAELQTNIAGNSSFGVVFQLESLGGAQVSIDYARVRVFYGWQTLERIDFGRFPK